MILHPQFRKEFGKYLKEKREAKKLTQTEVATALKYTSPQFISNCERGQCVLPMSKLKALVNLYGIPRGELAEILLDFHRRQIKIDLGLKSVSEKYRKCC
jgi:transcriptional regulator with XRE-family HTH domain